MSMAEDEILERNLERLIRRGALRLTKVEIAEARNRFLYEARGLSPHRWGWLAPAAAILVFGTITWLVLEAPVSLRPGAVLQDPESWERQSWEAAYVKANQAKTPDEEWKWIRQGLLTLIEGSRQHPQDPYIAYILGNTLIHKATWKEGVFQQSFLARVESDQELQSALQNGAVNPQPLTAFSLAILWLRRSLDYVQQCKNRQFETQLGFILHASSLDTWIYIAMYYQAYYFWRQGKSVDAATWFRDALQHVRGIPQRHPGVSPLITDYAFLCEHLAHAAENPPTTRDERMEQLETLTAVLLKVPRRDFGYLLEDLSVLKRELGGDAFEFNDSPDFASLLQWDKTIEATLAPSDDVDAFSALPRPPAKGLFRVEFQIKPTGSSLKVTLWTAKDGLLLQPTPSLVVQPDVWHKITGFTDSALGATLTVEPQERSAAASYQLRWSQSETEK
ncbi:MAG: hypothetical protein HYY16_03915 [Planctomycetes bacterium]|nr:hypothetical protein [Planctomycetota bacterium]